MTRKELFEGLIGTAIFIGTPFMGALVELFLRLFE